VVIKKKQVCFSLFYFSFLILNVGDDEPIPKDDQNIGNAPDEEDETGNQSNNDEDADNQGFFLNKSTIFIACILISYSGRVLASCLLVFVLDDTLIYLPS
jgi:hypothetical protein